jgi:molybdenum cofactor cytidylyltransferase
MGPVLRGIVLAAGESTRMGAPKALLRDGDGKTFASRIVHTFHSAGIADVTIVTGTLHTQIVQAIASDAPLGATIRIARNPDPSRGQLSSLVVGLDAVDAPGVSAALVTLVDVPFVAASTIRAVVAAWQRTNAPIVRPARGDRHGHPVLFAHVVFKELRTADMTHGAKSVVHNHAARIVNVDVPDEGALLDLDTPDEYARAIRP